MIISPLLFLFSMVISFILGIVCFIVFVVKVFEYDDEGVIIEDYEV